MKTLSKYDKFLKNHYFVLDTAKSIDTNNLLLRYKHQISARMVQLIAKPFDPAKWKNYFELDYSAKDLINLIMDQFYVDHAYLEGPLVNNSLYIDNKKMPGILLSDKGRYKLKLFRKALLLQANNESMDVSVLRRHSRARRSIKRFEKLLTDAGYTLTEKSFGANEDRKFGLIIQYTYTRQFKDLKYILFITYDVLMGNLSLFGSHCKYCSDIKYLSINDFKNYFTNDGGRNILTTGNNPQTNGVQ